MSLECSECERDLRGGHDPRCSRSKGWIKCKLPWTYYGDWADGPQMPSLHKEIAKEFGTTPEKEYRKLDKLEETSKEYKAAGRKYRRFAMKVDEWTKNHPRWKEYQEKLKAYDEKLRQKSFCGRGLNQPGTLIEVLDNKVLKTYLIGDINSLGGVCDDCMAFSRNVIVTRYKVLS